MTADENGILPDRKRTRGARPTRGELSPRCRQISRVAGTACRLGIARGGQLRGHDMLRIRDMEGLRRVQGDEDVYAFEQVPRASLRLPYPLRPSLAGVTVSDAVLLRGGLEYSRVRPSVPGHE